MIRPRDEKVIAGLSCSDVLALLSEYLDGDLAAEARQQVEDHLRGCDGCARFGGEFKVTVQALKFHLRRAPAVPPRVLDRLRVALDQER
jgi:anti-sigma factor RsiW